MDKKQEILSFILADINKPINTPDLQKILLNLSGLFANIGLSPYIFFEQKGGLLSFTLDHDLDSLEKIQAIRRNGQVNIENRKILLDIGYKLDFLIQKQIKVALTKHTTQPIQRNEATPLDFKKQVPNANSIFTTGYEGESIDFFLKKLLTHGIRKLLDVRKNPISRKYGFSKKVLASACTAVGITYQHFPNLGIPTDSRKNLTTPDDYQALFKEYHDTILQNTDKDQNILIDNLKAMPSVLMCFEADPNQCHRLTLAHHIADKINFKISNI